MPQGWKNLVFPNEKDIHEIAEKMVDLLVGTHGVGWEEAREIVKKLQEYF